MPLHYFQCTLFTPLPVKQRSMWRLLVPFLRWAQKKEKPSEGGAAASIL